MQQCYIKLFLSFVFFAKILCRVTSVDLNSHCMKCCGMVFFSFSFFLEGGRFCSEKALNRNLSLGLYFCIPASITITSEAGMTGSVSRNNQDYELCLCKLKQKSRLTTGNLRENFCNPHRFLHTRMP